METESLDTNILLRWVLGDVPKQEEIARKLLSKEGTVYDVADVAITEMVYVIEGITKKNRQEVTRAVRLVVARPNIRCNRALWDEVLPFYEAHPALSFNDCCLAGYAALKRAEPLWTFDRRLATQSGTAKLAR